MRIGLLNLMPVWPLDGGQVSRELWMKYRPYGGLVASLRMSMAVAIAFSAYAVGCEFDLIPRDFTVWWLRPGLFASARLRVPLADLPASRAPARDAWRDRSAAELSAASLASPST